MVTVKELIEKLQTLPEETIVRVVKAYTQGYDSWSEIVDLDFDNNFEFTDLRNNKYVTDPNQKKCYLWLGEK